jgi:hypothetical protein
MSMNTPLLHTGARIFLNSLYSYTPSCEYLCQILTIYCRIRKDNNTEFGDNPSASITTAID